jgi:peptide/nickel transport system permease protein
MSSVLVFGLVQILPGDVAAYMMGLNATPQALQHLRTELGLDLPLWRQYLDWTLDWCRADFGISYTYKVPVRDLVEERLLVSAPLAVLALLFAFAIALPTALLGARHANRRLDRVTAAVAQVGLAVPNYWLGLLLVLFFSIYLGWFPAGGFPGWGNSLSALWHLWLPAIALAVPQGCVLARILRTELDSILEQDFIRTARAKGAGEWRILWRHALPNALVPTLTVMGLQLSFLLAGAVIIETVFALPGIGRLLFQAAAQRDLMVIRSVVLLLVATVVFINLGVELLWALIDPRLKQRARL